MSPSEAAPEITCKSPSGAPVKLGPRSRLSNRRGPWKVPAPSRQLFELLEPFHQTFCLVPLSVPKQQVQAPVPVTVFLVLQDNGDATPPPLAIHFGGTPLSFWSRRCHLLDVISPLTGPLSLALVDTEACWFTAPCIATAHSQTLVFRTP